MSQSTIEWTDQTWSPVTGCTKISPGCQNCYAERMAKRQLGMAKARARKVGVTSRVWDAAMAGEKYRNGFNVTCHPAVLGDPLHWKKPRNIFVCSMSDLFHKDVPDDFISSVFAVMATCPQHTFQVLTKRPARMAYFMSADRLNNPGQRSRPHLINQSARDLHLKYPFASDDFLDAGRYDWPPPNVHLLTSCENQEMANLRIPHLLKCPGAVHGVSLEPLLGPVDLQLRRTEPCSHPGCFSHVSHPCEGCGYQAGRLPIDWVIVGGESGPGARPMDPEWVRDIRDQCVAAGVPFFFKGWGGVNKWKLGRELDGRTWDEMPHTGARI